MTSRIVPIMKKEIRQIKRDRRVLAVLILVPAMLLLLNGYAMNFDVQHIRMAVIDQERSRESRDLVNAYVTSGYFDNVASLSSSEEATALIDDATIKVAIVIPADFSSAILSNDAVDIQVLVDGTDSNSASTIIGYVQAVTLQYSQKIVLKNLAKLGRRSYIPIRYEARMWYNPELKSAKFLVPGLIGFILAITAVIATSLSIVKEKERNTIEQIDVSPVNSLVLTAAYFMFDVVVKGSLVDLFFATLLFIIAALSIGLFISTISDTQQVAFQLAALVSMLPTIILSGFMFPIRSMPVFLQVLSNITPAKYYLVILRSIILKGVGFAAWWDQVLYLCMFITVVLTLSVLRFKKTLG